VGVTVALPKVDGRSTVHAVDPADLELGVDLRVDLPGRGYLAARQGQRRRRDRGEIPVLFRRLAVDVSLALDQGLKRDAPVEPADGQFHPGLRASRSHFRKRSTLPA
jgi:hypothetical protein